MFSAAAVSGQESKRNKSAEILHELKNFSQFASVLYVAAHPDDENTELLAYLSHGRDYRTAYLSLTRGDGGQNILGPELGEKLGVARTQELLAARRIDGAQQYFSRAVDFGFSKDYAETLQIWNKEEVLSDIVRVMRTFRPDVVITRFSPSPGGTHGHHTASAVLAIEAFKLAGDPKAFPEQHLPPWQPKRIFWNSSRFQQDKITSAPVLKINAGGIDPVNGESFVDVAANSRSEHKTQGLAGWRPSGGIDRTEGFQLLAGEPATTDIMDGVNTSWNRIPGGAEIGDEAQQVIAQFDPKNVVASVPALLKLRAKLDGFHAEDPIVKDKRALLDHILQECLGLEVVTTIPRSDVVPGEELKLHHTAVLNADLPHDISVTWDAVQYPNGDKKTMKSITMHPQKPVEWDSIATLPVTTPLTQPWWLRSEGTAGMYTTNEPGLIGTAENAPAFLLQDIFEVGGQKLIVQDEPVQTTTDKDGHTRYRRMDVVPPVSMRFTTETLIFEPGTTRTAEVEITAFRGNSAGVLHLEAPVDWKIAPAKQSFNLAKVGQTEKFQFHITAPSAPSDSTKVLACADVHGLTYRNQRQEINYEHIPPQLLQPLATAKCVSFDLQIRGKRIGYLPGAGDSLAENMQQMGYTVVTLGDSNLTEETLSGFDAVVIGVRAFNVRENISAALPALFKYVEDGGTIIAQYNRPDKLKATKLAPYELHISSDRVTDQNAKVTFLAPDHPVLNTPNKITSADFDNWVQERGLYFPNQWDEHFTPIISCSDPGEPPRKGGLLVANYGKGYYVYTGLVFFRELPAGVPGAYRLFANMLSLGK